MSCGVEVTDPQEGANCRFFPCSYSASNFSFIIFANWISSLSLFRCYNSHHRFLLGSV